MPNLKILPMDITVEAPVCARLLSVLRDAGVHVDAPCGGQGTCGKCRVRADGAEVLACQTLVEEAMTVAIPESGGLNILRAGVDTPCRTDPWSDGPMLAFDIGTTSVVCFLLDGNTGAELASASMLNPQTAFGADVISRIQAALGGALIRERDAIRRGMTELIGTVCETAGVLPKDVGAVSVVGNPAMQQLFLGISPENLAAVPFAPVLTEAKAVPCGDVLPICPDAPLLIVPDISGYVGADTVGCVLSTRMYESESVTLMVDIGTNGEMVLGGKNGMIACSTAAGPALEGANIRFGMRGAPGAIDHVRMEDGALRCGVIGGGEARGVCGSGLIDAAAAFLDAGLLNRRGRIQNDAHILRLTDGIYLTQDDIRQLQLAKGAIQAGVRLMARELGVELRQIDRVLLAGAFGSYLDPHSACRVGLLPEELEGKIAAVGNAAGSGAKILALDKKALPFTQELTKKIRFLELASLPDFSRTFAKCMEFREGADA